MDGAHGVTDHLPVAAAHPGNDAQHASFRGEVVTPTDQVWEFGCREKFLNIRSREVLTCQRVEDAVVQPSLVNLYCVGLGVEPPRIQRFGDIVEIVLGCKPHAEFHVARKIR